MRENQSLIIPIENQVRELDAKLFFACIAASHGFRSTIGPRHEINYRIASFPNGMYIAHGMAGRSATLFRMVRRAGHEIITWDEEALVHLPPEIYFSRRISSEAVKHVSHLFAWGEDNAQLWRQYTNLPAGTQIHVTGNPRGDLLRSEMRPFFKQDVNRLRKKYGNIILINTNFNHVNAFYPYMNLFQPANKAGEAPEFGSAARGMTLEYAEGLRDHKQARFEDFKQLIPSLAVAFPDYTIIVRPHPTENRDVYHKIAELCQNVQVINKGGVVPWLMAAKMLVHNGCTTGVEAHLLGTPAISYRSGINDYYDFGFYRLPNAISHQCVDFEQLQATIRRILEGELGVADGAERKALIDRHLSAQEGKMACQRIVDVISHVFKDRSKPGRASLRHRLNRWVLASQLRLVKLLSPHLPRSHNRPEFLRHRYPGISLDEIRARVSRFQRVPGVSGKLKVDEVNNQIFRLSV